MILMVIIYLIRADGYIFCNCRAARGLYPLPEKYFILLLMWRDLLFPPKMWNMFFMEILKIDAQ